MIHDTRRALVETSVAVDGAAIPVNDASCWTLHLQKSGAGTADFRIWGRVDASTGWFRIDGSVVVAGIPSPGFAVSRQFQPLSHIRVDVTAITGGTATALLVVS